MPVGILTLHLHMNDCFSLKDKRSRIKPLLSRLHKDFNFSTAELGLLDRWHDSIIGCALIANDSTFIQSSFEPVPDFIARLWPEIEIWDKRIDII